MKRRAQTTAGLALALYAFAYLPLAVIFTASFNESRFGTEWKGFTLAWYRMAVGDSQIASAIKSTLLVAAVSTAISTFLGTLLAYGLTRHPFKARPLVSGTMLLAIAVPDIVMAVALLLFYSLVRQWTGLFQLGYATMILAHVTFQLPFVALVIAARLRGLDPAIEEAASDLGASRTQRLWRVTLPLMRPGILAGALLAFTLSLDDFVVSFFTSGPGTTTLPIFIYSAVKRGISGEIHALSSMLIAAAIVGTIGVTFLQARNKNLT